MSVQTTDEERIFLHTMDLMNDGADGSGEICKTLKLNGITDIIGFFALTKAEIETLEYKDGCQTNSLNQGQRSMICILSVYNTSHIRAGMALKPI